MKTCKTCGVTKELDDFHRGAAYAQGRLPHCKECRSKQMRAKGNPETRRRWHLKHAYDLTPEEEATMVERQGGTCAICGDPLASTPTVDHCHTTKKVRGLLCRTCNLGLGHFKDDVSRLQGAINYLRRV